MSVRRSMDSTIMVLAVVGSLIVVNILAVEFFGRMDLTRDQQFTLSAASRSTVRNLQDPITVRAYFSANMPAPYSSHARYVRDLLEEYYANGGGNFRYEFIDPLSEETAEDKAAKKNVKHDIFGRAVREATTIERELQTLGIPPLQIRVNEDDKLEVKRVYMGLAIKYGDQTEVIPVVQETAGLEYDLTTLIRKLARERTPKVAFVGGHNGPQPDKDLTRLWGLLGQLYDLSTVDLAANSEIPDDVDALIVAGPQTPLSAAELRAIDSFVMSGRSVAFLLDAVKVDFATLQPTEAQHGVGGLLEAYGVQVEEGVVLDKACATINVTQQRGFMRVAQPVPYPFMPLVRSLDANHPLTRGLAEVAFPFMSALTVVAGADDGVQRDVLVESSGDSWIQTAPYNLDPFQRWTIDSIAEQHSNALLVSLSGGLPSAFSDGAEAVVANNARVLVAGGSGFITDQFMSPTNEALVLNLMDWLLLDEALLAVRARGLASAPLVELDDTERELVKYFNMLGLPAFVAVFGIARWRRRESRRKNVSV